MSELKMQSPWVVWAKKLGELFGNDPDVTVAYKNDEPHVKVFVRGADKAESINEILPCEVTFGNVSMPIDVIPDNDSDMTIADHLRRAFAGNPALVDVIEGAVVPGGPSMTYALFAPAVVQVECDNAASPYGILTTTYEDVAREVLAADGVLISSDIADD